MVLEDAGTTAWEEQTARRLWKCIACGRETPEQNEDLRSAQKHTD